MGSLCCNETEEQHSERNVRKLLLLGAGDSGKTTLFRQLKLLHGEWEKGGISERERCSYKDPIHNNILEAIQKLVENNLNFAAEDEEFQMEESSRQSAYVVENPSDNLIDKELSEHIKILWRDPGIQRTWRRRSEFQFQDSSTYYFNNLDRISLQGYIPSEQDIIRCRVRTTGIVEQRCTVEGSEFRILDVGGQRNERKKWFYCFEDVDGLIFVCNLSGYDQTGYEDDVNRMHLSIRLFQETVNSRWFKESTIILFLNKRDLFEEKIGSVRSQNPLKVPLSACFPKCPVHNDDPYTQGIKYIKRQFRQQIRDRDKSHLHIHVTCATDKNTMERVFISVKKQIIQRALKNAALL